MWKITLGFVFHRVVLLVVALLTLNTALSGANKTSAFKIQSFSNLMGEFLSRVEKGPESKILFDAEGAPVKEIFSASRSPFIWAARFVRAISGMRVGLVVLILSNLFFYFAIWETYVLASRMALPEVAEATALLMVFWITSYELSLGSELALTCLFSALVLRNALDNQWLIAGFALGGLALTETLAIALLPILIAVFWSYQQHFQAVQVIRRAIYFLVPFLVVVALHWSDFIQVPALLGGSALVQLGESIRGGSFLSLTIAHSTLGQTLTLVLFSASAFSILFGGGMLFQRLMPTYVWLVVLLFSPYGLLASRALVAGIALEGIASISATAVVRGTLLVCLVFSSYEVFLVFR